MRTLQRRSGVSMRGGGEYAVRRPRNLAEELTRAELLRQRLARLEQARDAIVRSKVCMKA